ncbi:regulator of protease activity HflC (stomatin/prohibitin superfamily) [Deinococcus metalli]|uniref:Membrane protein n=1 Tax=Deinococcus metalli TaxID=1141878 RepID=A0A7W8NQC0_9DEIO|nr:SPFH domain-containing protein [Deinococcus metalli]MBB5378889.1 regulator of protease activity HflC (stomatin/prohibitin superfamily) [Deinococcus metalli]GHF62456.1 membrane protein [Deinococcus metalli]
MSELDRVPPSTGPQGGVSPRSGVASSERAAFGLPGVPFFVAWLVLLALAILSFAFERVALGAVLAVIVAFTVGGFYIVQPNQSKVLTLFGRYVGTERRNGVYWTNPLTVRKTVSLRIRNFNSERLKVNDASGNPIEIAAVIVWRVVDTARAVFDVEDYAGFVAIQAETALRHLASQYPYDDYSEGGMSLRGNADEVSEALRRELGVRLQHAGVDILEARLSHLAYSPEIAGAMLQRQQASAIIAARSQIVQGAVGMVEMALRELSDQNIVQLDEERKAQMVSNLLVVLTSERGTQPVVNAGSLY